MINDFLSELSDLLEKYNYSIFAETSPAGFDTVNIKKPSHSRTEKLYTSYDQLDKDSISKYFASKLEWEPISEPLGTVKFLGKDIFVFNESGWLAMDKNGSVFYFADEPTIQNDNHYELQVSSTYLGTMVGFKKPDSWKNSAMYFNLREGENEEV